MILPVFKAGDRVTWRSSYTPKTGEVVGIVPPKVPFGRVIAEHGIAGRRIDGGGLSRDHVSYVVRVGSKLYWPKVAGLRAVSGADDEGREREVSMACARASGAVFSYRNLLEDARLLSSEIDRLRGLLAGGSR